MENNNEHLEKIPEGTSNVYVPMNCKTKVCPKCKNMIPYQVKVCPVCKKKQPVQVSGCAVVVVMMAILAAILVPQAIKSANSTQSSATSVSAAASFESKIARAMNCSEEQAIKVKGILDRAGLSGYESIVLWQTDEIFDYFEISAANRSFILTMTKDGVIDELNIKLSTAPPLVVNGNVEHHISEYSIGEELMMALRVECQMQLQNNILKVPDSAEYPSKSGWSYSKDWDTGIVYVSSYVDSQNSFGVEIRSNFMFGFEITNLTTQEFKIVYIKFDDEVIADYR